MGDGRHASYISYNLFCLIIISLMNIFNGTKECPDALACCPSAISYPRLLPWHLALPPHRALIARATLPCLCLEALALPTRLLPGPRCPCAPLIAALTNLAAPALPPRRALRPRRTLPKEDGHRSTADTPGAATLSRGVVVAIPPCNAVVTVRGRLSHPHTAR